jgi:hypothetical protein
MEDELRLDLLEEASGIRFARQVVVPSAGDERVEPLGTQPFNEVRAEESPSSRHEHAHAASVLAP